MPQRKLICPSPATATRLAEKIGRHRPGREFRVYGVSLGRQVAGYQVVEVRRFAGFGYAWDGQRWTRIAKKPWLAPAKAIAPREVVTATVSLPFAQETKAYIGAVVNGVVAWFGKSNIIAFSIENGMVSMTLPSKFAAKRGIGA